MSDPRRCVNCGDPCPPGLRWCSTACFYEEDGYSDDPPVDGESTEEDE